MPKFQPRNPDFRVTVERYVAAQRYLALLGVALNRVEPGLAEYELPYREDIGQAPWPSSNRPPPAAKKRPPKPAAEPPSPRSSRQGDGDPRRVERLPKAAFNKEEIFLMLMLSRRTSARHPRDPSFRDRSSGLRRSCAAGNNGEFGGEFLPDTGALDPKFRNRRRFPAAAAGDRAER